MFVASTHDNLLCFTDSGRVFKIKVYEAPEMARTAKGRSIRNLIELRDGEKAVEFMPIRDFEKHEDFLVFATAHGKIKRSSLRLYQNVNRGGIIAVDLDPEKVKAFSVDMGALLQRLRADNFRSPAGKVSVEEESSGKVKHNRDVYLVADSKFGSIREIEALPVRPGLRLSDITRHGFANGKSHRGVYETYSVNRYVRIDRQRGASASIWANSSCVRPSYPPSPPSPVGPSALVTASTRRWKR